MLAETVSRGIWQTTLVLVLIALLAVLVLVLRRLLAELRRERLTRRREVARRLILGRLRGSEEVPDPRELADLPTEFLIELVDELAQMVRGEGRTRLAALGRRLGLVDRLLADLRSWRPGRRQEAARRLALYGDRRVVPALREALDDPAPAVRVAAATALLGRDGTAEEPLRHARRDPAFSKPAAFAFWLRLAELLPDRFEELFAEPCPAARRTVMLKAAGAAGLARLVPRIAADTVAADPAIRRAATLALLDLKHPLAFDALSRLLADPDPRLRAEAAIAVGRRRLPALLGALRDRLEDPDPTVRFRAEEAILRLGGAPAGGGGP